MQLSSYISFILVFCIPFIFYINASVKPRKGFSILFISVISIIGFLNQNYKIFGCLSFLIPIGFIFTNNYRLNYCKREIDLNKILAKNFDEKNFENFENCVFLKMLFFKKCFLNILKIWKILFFWRWLNISFFNPMFLILFKLSGY